MPAIRLNSGTRVHSARRWRPVAQIGAGCPPHNLCSLRNALTSLLLSAVHPNARQRRDAANPNLWLGKLLKRSGDGIIYNDDEAGAIGARLFGQACKMGLEGIVSNDPRHDVGDEWANRAPDDNAGNRKSAADRTARHAVAASVTTPLCKRVAFIEISHTAKRCRIRCRSCCPSEQPSIRCKQAPGSEPTPS